MLLTSGHHGCGHPSPAKPVGLWRSHPPVGWASAWQPPAVVPKCKAGGDQRPGLVCSDPSPFPLAGLPKRSDCLHPVVKGGCRTGWRQWTGWKQRRVSSRATRQMWTGSTWKNEGLYASGLMDCADLCWTPGGDSPRSCLSGPVGRHTHH